MNHQFLLAQYERYEKPLRYVLYGFLMFLYLVALWRTAWAADDAVITYRVVINLINGYGPVLNIGERVQAYTHPLWFVMLSLFAWIARDFFSANSDVFAGAFILSFILSLGTFWLFLNCFTKNTINVLLGAGALLLSRAFIDYSTSGLENPLTHLLLLLFVYYSIQENEKQDGTLFKCYMLAAMLYLNRPDSILFVIPPLVLFSWRYLFNAEDRKVLYRSVGFSALPVLLWMLFSVIYYGFPFPNTAYAKLMVNIPFSEKASQGLNYVYFSLIADTLTVSIVFIAFVYMIFKSNMTRAFAVGFIVYIFYVVSIGGDFMLGRFFSGIFLLACIFLISADVDYKHLYFYKIRKFSALIAFCLFFLALAGFNGYWVTWVLGNRYTDRNYDYFGGIADERCFWVQTNSLPQFFEGTGTFPKGWVDWTYKGQTGVHVTYGNLGVISVKGGAGQYTVDRNAIADPLLARLPRSGYWRIGHFFRKLPKGYTATLENGVNTIENPEIRAYYDTLVVIVRGPIFSLKRFSAIIRINLGLIPRFQDPNYEEDS